MTRMPARLRLRRRLLRWSALPTVLAMLLAVKLISVVVVGDSAQRHFGDGEIGALRGDVSILRLFNVVEPNTASVAGGSLAVLEGNLGEADVRFSAVLEKTEAEQSCALRINLMLVRERQGDIDAWEARLDQARLRYESALTAIADAPVACFAGNTDPDPERRAVRQDAAARIAAKIDGLGTVAPLAPPAPPAPSAATPSAPPAADPDRVQAPDERRLDLQQDPLDALRQLLQDAAG